MLNPVHANRVLPLTIAFLIAIGVFVPARFLAFERHFGWLASALVAPVSHPLAAFSRWIAPGDVTGNQSEAMRELSRQKEEAEAEVLRLRAEIHRLGLALEDMKIFSAVNNSPVRQVFAPVFASSSDLSTDILRVRAGTRDGVEFNTVATTTGMQLLGKVVSVDARMCDLLPFTARAAGPVQGMVMLDANSADGLICKLEPVGDGTLKGPVEDRRDAPGAAIEPKIGQLVRLSDPGRWPQNAQMLILGRVIAVETLPSGPLRRVVIVQPTIERLDRVAEVVLRTSVRSPGGEP